MFNYEINATYGSANIPCTILVCTLISGAKWYAVDGGTNANLTYDDLDEGVDIETLTDCDHFTVNEPIDNMDRFIELINM